MGATNGTNYWEDGRVYKWTDDGWVECCSGRNIRDIYNYKKPTDEELDNIRELIKKLNLDIKG